MPIRTTPDPAERKQIEGALDRLNRNAPKAGALNKRARRGSLQTNLNTLAIESGVRRHRIEKLYPDLAATANEQRGARGESEPLRKQLDAARRDKAVAERRRESSQTYSFRLMERISQFRSEVRMLNDRVAELETELAGSGGGDDLFMGSDDVLGIPSMPAKKRSGKHRGAATH